MAEVSDTNGCRGWLIRHTLPPAPRQRRARATLSAMKSEIAGFERDEVGDWVALLACGHRRHVRHDPPWQNRPWVVTNEGRTAALGQELDCRDCDRQSPPAR